MLEIINIEGQGFKVLKDYDSWRIAQLGYDAEVNSVSGIKYLGRHHETHEVFVLIKGTAYMLTGGFDKKPLKFEIEKLENNKLYTIKESQWHAALLKPGSNILIVENRDTDEFNSENYKLNNKKKLEISKLMEKFNK